MFYTFKNIEYYDDQNYLFTDRTMQNYTAFSSVKESVDLRPLSTTTIPNSFLALSINNAPFKQVYYRRYYKVQNCIADLGGILKGILLIASGINYFFSSRYYIIDIVNNNLGNYRSLNEHKDKNLDYTKIADKSANSAQVMNMKNNNYVKSKNIQAFKLPFYLSCVPKHLLRFNKKTRDYVNELEVLKKATERQMDICYILNKLNIVDKLTYILFGNNPKRIENSSNPYMFNKDLGEMNQTTNPETDLVSYMLCNYNTLLNI